MLTDTACARRTGISAIGEVPWGSHFCQFYRTREDLISTLVPYFTEGLKANECCMWVTSAPLDAREAIDLMRLELPDFDRYLDSGQIEIVDHADWYAATEHLPADRVLHKWIEKQEQAVARGYEGLRLTGNTFWLERSGWDGFMAYEEKVNRLFSRFRLIALCTYCLDRCSATDVLDVVRNHQFALARREGTWEMLESSSLKVAKEELRRFNAALERRVDERTQELQEAKEAAEAASRAKDRFLAVLSHELRTPLTPVLAGVTEFESCSELPDETRAEMSVLRRNIEMEVRLIDDLLDLTRLGQGKVELHQEATDVHLLLRAAIDVLRRGMENKETELLLALRARRAFAWADPGRLQQVLINLLNNAVKFSPPGGRVGVHTFNEDDDHLVVQVSDSGEGIEPEALARIFNAFEQGEQTVQRKYGGLGLGLTISKLLVDLHGGELSASSEGKGKGATFTMRLSTVTSTSTGDASQTAINETPARRGRILLVDDHQDTLRVLARLLQRQGHIVQTAASVAEALEVAETAQFQLLITDLGLPDGCGTEIMQKLATKGVKGVALSGFGMEEDVRRSLEAGFAQHLTKPVDFKTLDGVTRALLE